MDIDDPLVAGEHEYLQRAYGTTHPEIVAKFDELVRKARLNGGVLDLPDTIHKAEQAAFHPKPAPALQ